MQPRKTNGVGSVPEVFKPDHIATSHRTMRPFVFGDGVALRETDVDPRNDPVLGKWSRFWLDSAGFDRVKGSLSELTIAAVLTVVLAQHLPGTNVGTFKMPQQLNTVNTFIFRTFDPYWSYVSCSDWR